MASEQKYVRGEIVAAAENGNIKQLKHFLNNGANIEEQFVSDWTPLMCAANKGQKAAVEFLIASNANVNHTGRSVCALILAASGGHKDVCEALLKAGADITVTFNGRTAAQEAAAQGHQKLAEIIEAWGQTYKHGDVIIAAKSGDIKQVEQCLNKGASVDERNSENYTPLIIAAFKGHKHLLDFLIARKANVQHTNQYGDSSLSMAAYFGHKDICETLLKAGADKNMKCRGKTAAEWAAARGHHALAAFIARTQDPSVSATVSKVAAVPALSTPAAVRQYKQGDIVKAAEKGDVRKLEECINNGANVDEQDENRWTALLWASCYKHKAAVDFLVSRKANVIHTSEDGFVALWWAAFNGIKDTCEALLKAGADRNIKHDGKTPSQVAAERGHKELAAFIEAWGQKYYPAHIIGFAKSGDVKKLEECINIGANVDEQDSVAMTPLIMAAASGQKAAIDFLLAHKANVNHTNNIGQFALYFAACKGYNSICEALLKAGADKNMKRDGKTAAQWAVEQGHTELAVFIESWGQRAVGLAAPGAKLSSAPDPPLSSSSFLASVRKHIVMAAEQGDVKQLEECINFGANIDEQDMYGNGQTALIKATLYGHKAAVDFLIAHKANVNHQDKYGDFALYFAASKGHKDICAALLKAGADKSMKFSGKTAAQWAAEQGHKELAAFIESWGQVLLATSSPQSPLPAVIPVAVVGVTTSGAVASTVVEAAIRAKIAAEYEAKHRAELAALKAAADDAQRKQEQAEKEKEATKQAAVAEYEAKLAREREVAAKKEQQLKEAAEQAHKQAEAAKQAEEKAKKDKEEAEKKAADAEAKAAVVVSPSGGGAAYYASFKGDFELPLPKSSLEEIGDKVFGVDLSSSEATHQPIIARVHAALGERLVKKIQKIQVVFSPGRYRIFLGQLETIEKRSKEAAFQPHLEVESDSKTRAAVLDHLYAQCGKVKCNRNVKLLQVWHGMKSSILLNVLEGGFAAIATLDEGWYGKGIYFSTNAAYAERYANKPKCLVMCYVALLNPYPITAADAPADKAERDFAFYGKGNHKNYMCHYARVAPAEEEPTLDYRPPADPSGCTRDELVVFQESYILPQIVVHLS